MIGKVIKGRGFRGCLNYVLGKEGAQLIGGNMSGRNARELAAEFRFSRRLNPRVERVVCHVTLSLPCREGYRECLDDDTWNAIAADYLEGMGFTQNQYVAARHTDTNCDHLHIVASRIRMDGSCVRDGWDYRRSEATIRKIEQRYGLEAVTPSWETERSAPSTGQVRRKKKQENDCSQGKRDEPAGAIAKVTIQAALDAATLGAGLTLTQLIEELEGAGVEMRFNVSRNGDIRGITYIDSGVPFSASQLGAGKNPYTIAGLQERRGVSLALERDAAAIAQRAYNNQGEKHDPEKICNKIRGCTKNQRLQVAATALQKATQSQHQGEGTPNEPTTIMSEPSVALQPAPSHHIQNPSRTAKPLSQPQPTSATATGSTGTGDVASSTFN